MTHRYIDRYRVGARSYGVNVQSRNDFGKTEVENVAEAFEIFNMYDITKGRQSSFSLIQLYDMNLIHLVTLQQYSCVTVTMTFPIF